MIVIDHTNFLVLSRVTWKTLARSFAILVLFVALSQTLSNSTCNAAILSVVHPYSVAQLKTESILDSQFTKTVGTICVLVFSFRIKRLKALPGYGEKKENLLISQDLKDAIYHAIPDFIILFNREGVCLECNNPNEFVHYRGIMPTVGANVRESLPPEAAQEILEKAALTLATGSSQFELMIGSEDQPNFFEARLVKVDNEKVLGVFREITQRKLMEQHLNFISLHDSLTGIYNRYYFEDKMLHLQGQDKNRVGILVCDLDGLKIINDTLGHHQGDELLKKVAVIINSVVELPSFAARIGGDEFAVVLYEPTKEKMEAIQQHFEEEVVRHNNETPHLPMALSIGWAASFDGTSCDQIFKEADNNMYRQKMHQSHSIRGRITGAMMKALEVRDYITGGHADRVGDLLVRMGKLLQLSHSEVADLLLLAKFHDIGKVGIPDNILNKPGRLTDEEMTIMKRHCEIGYRIANSLPDLAPIADWVLKHHEHWNGGGYPLTIGGEAIPIQCRILAIVDAYDAMTNDRPYRKALCHSDAIEEIRRCAGTQFDAELTEIFIKMITLVGH